MTTLISSYLDLGQRSILLQYVDAIRLNATSTEAVGLAYGLAGLSIALMKTATLLGDKKLENEAISLLKSCLINHQLPLLVVGGRIHWSRCSIQSRPRTYLYAQI